MSPARVRRRLVGAALVCGVSLGTVSASAQAATPSVRITSPARNATVSGKIVFKASRTHAIPLALVRRANLVYEGTPESN